VQIPGEPVIVKALCAKPNPPSAPSFTSILRGQCEEKPYYKGETDMKKLLSLILCFAMVLTLAACGGTTENADAIKTVTDGQTVGEGSKTFPLTITDKDGKSIQITVKTDEETVGDALVAIGLVQGEKSEYGLYVKAVNGITADYEADKTYWAFYINGEYALTGVDQTPIADGETYTLAVEAG
jgi:hypothetical protein